jgi:DNA-binding transcriptional LysR family regulator
MASSTSTGNLGLLSLRIFLAVYEQRSVGAAASSLGMSQSGVSSALARLRKQLGDALFVSTASGMQPTTRAKELAAPAREAVQCIEQRILGKATFDPASDEREFRIALSDTAEAMYLPRVLAALGHAAPRVRLRSVAMPQPHVQRALSEGQVDIALGYFPDLRSAEFMRRKIGQHGFACICSSANRQVIQGFDLRKYSEARHAVVEAPTRTHGLLETYLQKRGIGRRIALTTPHFMSLPEIIAGTDLLATVPDAIAEAFVQNRRLVQLDLPFRSPVFEAHLHWSKSVSSDPAHRWLRGVVFDALAGKG